MSSKIRDIGVFNVKNMGYRGKKNLIYMQLRVMRVKRDVSQKELSARMQVMGFSMDQQTISNIENNKRIVTDYELAGFCWRIITRNIRRSRQAPQGAAAS